MPSTQVVYFAYTWNIEPQYGLKGGEDPMKRFTGFTLDQVSIDRLRELAAHEEMTRSQTVRRLIKNAAQQAGLESEHPPVAEANQQPERS